MSLCIHRLRGRRAVLTEGLQKHAVEPQLARVAEGGDADRHAVMPEGRLCAVGAEQAIPPRHVEAEVAAGFPPVDRMVNTVYVRRHHYKTETSIEAARQPHIAVVEERGGVEQDFEDEYGEAAARRARLSPRA